MIAGNTGHPDHLKWKGAELISPAFDWESTGNVAAVLSRCEDDYFPRLKEAGAVCKADLRDGLHVHFDISALSWTEVRELLLAIVPVQMELSRLKSEWWGHHLFQRDELESFRTAKTQNEFDVRYRTIRSWEGGLFLLPRWHDRIRRIVDVGPYLDPNRPDTIEFRCFRAAMDTSYIAECIDLAREVLRGCHRTGFANDIETRVEELLRKHQEHVFNDELAGLAGTGGPPPELDELWRVTPDVALKDRVRERGCDPLDGLLAEEEEIEREARRREEQATTTNGE